MAKSRSKPLCNQCRRYAMDGNSIVSVPLGEVVEPAMRLRRKTQPNAKTKRGVDSYPVKRVGL